MSEPVRWYVRPRVVLPVVGALVILLALGTPERVAGRNGDSRLTTYSTTPQGAQLVYDLVHRLGWRTVRALTPDVPGDSNAVIAILDPAVDIRRVDTHLILERVRAGAALLFVLGTGTPLSDSLHVGSGNGGFAAVDSAAECKATGSPFQPLWFDDRPHLTRIRWRGPPPPVDETLVPLIGLSNSDRERYPVAAVGFALGKGRVVVVADPDFLRNDVVRACKYGIDLAVVRAFEYLSGGGPAPRTQVVFDEYHQGYGAQPGTMRAIVGYLRDAPTGRALLQVLFALLVLLAATAPRIVPPQPVTNLERRSPFEHVDALARAYEGVRGTRTVTLRLLHGIRRRFERGAVRSAHHDSDDAFLERVESTNPQRARDVALVRRALGTPLENREMLTVGAALDRIESSLTRT